MKRYEYMPYTGSCELRDDDTGKRIITGGIYYLASDVDRLRAEGRERVAKELQRWHESKYGDNTYATEAERILSALFDEGRKL